MPSDLPRIEGPVAIVLGAPVLADGRPSPALRRRALTAARLYRNGEVHRIVASGGVVRHPPAEATVIAEELKSAEVPPEAILIDDNARSTLSNLTGAIALLPPETPLVLVTDGFHMPRARLTARRLGLTARGVSPAPEGSGILRLTRSVLREIPALVYYALRPIPRIR